MVDREAAIAELEGTEEVSDVLESEGTEEVSSEVKDSAYDIDGEKFSINDIKSWKEYFGLKETHVPKSEYTKKTQELADRSRTLKDAEELQGYFMKMRNSNPQLFADVQKLISEAHAKQNGQSPEAYQLAGRLNQLEQQLRDQEMKNQDIVFDNIMKELAVDKQYNGFFADSDNDREFSRWIAGYQGVNDVRSAAKEYFNYITKKHADTKIRTEEEMKKNIAERAKKGIRPKSSSMSPTNESGETLDPRERRRLAKEFLGSLE